MPGVIATRFQGVTTHSPLVGVFGWPSPLIHGDTGVTDRWLWLRKRLPRSDGSQQLLDIGCGTGAFTIGCALRGYRALGLSWDRRNQTVAAERSRMCGADNARFDVQDIRELHMRGDLLEKFDMAVLCEVIEHIIDDKKLLRDAAACLKPGGKLLLTTPNFDLIPIDPSHLGPFPTVEDGGHVRKGYTEAELRELCSEAELIPDSISYCTGVISQKICYLNFRLVKIRPLLGWLAILPFRILPPLLDPILSKALQYPFYSICLEAHKESDRKQSA